MTKIVTPANRRVFVTGTDTDIGKTVVSGMLAAAWDAHYWKPVQAGRDPSTDSKTIAAWLGPDKVLPERHCLQHPMSPNQAAELENVQLNLEDFQLPATTGPLVVEGAGGLMVPINNRHMIIDLIQKLKLPVVLAARTGLGTLNHTLLSIAMLRQRAVPVAGLILVGDPHPQNTRDLVHFGQVPLWGRLPIMAEINKVNLIQAYSQLEANYKHHK